MKDSLHNGNESASESEPRRPDVLAPQSESEYLRLLGESVRAARARRGMTRKMLAADSGVSERFLAQLESGTGNASILVLRQIARALDLPLKALLPESETASPDLERSIELLQRLDPVTITKAREVLLSQFGGQDLRGRRDRIALIGLRGAGKSSVGKLLADRLRLPFFELDKRIEKASGISLNMIFEMYGQSGFRRFERRCLDDLLSKEDRFVLATGGGLVSEPTTCDRLLSACYTVWLQATPQEHMSRVIAQGDMRPMTQSSEAMADLERILTEREPLYRRADAVVDTSGRTIGEVLDECLQRLAAPAAQNSV
jgi:XRE family aerobic/anaerobic benzoate catabolism transcriptional regulator